MGRGSSNAQMSGPTNSIKKEPHTGTSQLQMLTTGCSHSTLQHGLQLTRKDMAKKAGRRPNATKNNTKRTPRRSLESCILATRRPGEN